MSGNTMVASALTTVDNLFQAKLDSNTPLDDFSPDSCFDEDAYNSATSLNSVSGDKITPGSLVKIRCMIQSSYDPELYLDTFEIVDQTGNRQLRCGRYRDNAGITNESTIDFNSSKNVMKSRQTLYCVPVPAETEWVKSKYDALQAQTAITTTAQTNRTEAKRSRDDDEEDEMDMTDTDSKSMVQDPPSSAETASKKPREQTNTPSLPSTKAMAAGFDLNFPIKGETGPAVMAKFYSEDAPRINQMVEIIGIYDIDPSVASVDFGNDMFGTEEELRARHPPSSLIARVHCLRFRILQHTNPLLPAEIPHQVRVNAMDQAANVRAQLLSTIATVVGGDALAAEYILLNILSGVHTRKDGSSLVLGKLPLNLHGAGIAAVAPSLSHLCKAILTKSHYLSLDLEAMEQYRMNPHKNVQTGRLDAGLLQLTAGTHVIVDETKMAEGHLKNEGIKNLKALAQAMQNQTVEFEFEYAPLTFEIDVSMLVLSEGKSLFPVDLHVPLQSGPLPVHPEVSEELLNQFRSYITLARSTEYEITEAVREVIQSDFVKMRQEDAATVKGETLHNLLIQARLMSQSFCQPVLSVDVWGAVIKLDRKRRAQIQSTTPAKK